MNNQNNQSENNPTIEGVSNIFYHSFKNSNQGKEKEKKKSYNKIDWDNLFVAIMFIALCGSFIVSLSKVILKANTHQAQKAIPVVTQPIEQKLIGPSIKDLTLPTGFRNLKWGDGVEKLKRPVLVTDNSKNTKVGNTYINSDLKSASQCYVQKGESMNLGLAKLSKISYCFLDNHFFEVKVSRVVISDPHPGDANCSPLYCVEEKDKILNNLFMDYLSHTYNVSKTKDLLPGRDFVNNNSWTDSQGRLIKFNMDDVSQFTISTDAYDAQADKKVDALLNKENHTTSEGNNSN